MRGSEIFYRQVHNPVAELVVTASENAVPLTVKVMEDIKGSVSAVAVVREVWGI